MNRFLPFRLPSPLEALLAVSWAILVTLSLPSEAQTALDNPYPNPYEWMYEEPNAARGDPQAGLWWDSPQLNPRAPYGTPTRRPYGAVIGHSHGPRHRTYIQWHPDWGAPAQAPYVQVPEGSFYDDEPGY